MFSLLRRDVCSNPSLPQTHQQLTFCVDSGVTGELLRLLPDK